MRASCETVESLSKHGGKVIGETFDMDNFDDYPAWLTKTADALGGCDIFIPNVSASGAGATDDWDKCVQYDLKGTAIGGYSNHIWKNPIMALLCDVQHCRRRNIPRATTL